MFYVMDFVEGRIFWDPALPEISDNAERAAIYDAMNADVGRRCTTSTSTAAGLGDFGQPGQLFRAPVGALDKPVPGVRNRNCAPTWTG